MVLVARRGPGGRLGELARSCACSCRRPGSRRAGSQYSPTCVGFPGRNDPITHKNLFELWAVRAGACLQDLGEG